MSPDWIAAGCAIVATLLAVGGMWWRWILPHLREQITGIEQVREQVANTHDSNLRDDLDRVIEQNERILQLQAKHDSETAEIRASLRAQAASIDGLRGEVIGTNRRIDRIDTRLDQHIDRRNP